VYAAHERRCDLGYLREPYMKPDGELGYRCAAEPVEDFVAKGGTVAETVGRKCLCNGLLAAVGLGQVRSSGAAGGASWTEPPIVTAGAETAEIARFLAPGAESYTADDVLDRMLGADGGARPA
jgi:hypothetical protein